MHLLAIPCFQQNIPLQYAVSKTKLAPVRASRPARLSTEALPPLSLLRVKEGPGKPWMTMAVCQAHIYRCLGCVCIPTHSMGQDRGPSSARQRLRSCYLYAPNVQRNLNILGYLNVHLRIYSQVFCGAVILTERIITRPKALRKLKHGVCDSLSALHLSRPILPWSSGGSFRHSLNTLTWQNPMRKTNTSTHHHR